MNQLDVEHKQRMLLLNAQGIAQLSCKCGEVLDVNVNLLRADLKCNTCGRLYWLNIDTSNLIQII